MQNDKIFFKFVSLSSIISCLAGVFLLHTSNYSALLFFVFGLLAILPVIMVSLIKGIRAGAVSTFITTILSCFALPINVSILFLIIFLMPALYMSFLLSIVAIRKDSKQTYWVPLSSLLFNICIICVIAVIITAGFIDTYLPQPLLSDATFSAIKSFFYSDILTSMSSFGMDVETINEFKQTIDDNFIVISLAIMSWGIIGSLFSMLLMAIYIATRFVADKKISPRPRNFWPNDLVMPSLSIGIFTIALITSSFSKLNYTLLLCMISLATAFALGFFVSGLAFIHNITSGKKWQIIALATTYFLLVSFIFSGIATIIIISLGILSTILNSISNKNQQINNSSY